MKALIHWSDGVEESRDFDEHAEVPDRLVVRRFRSSDESVTTLAGRRLDGTPIYYEDVSLVPHPWGDSIQLMGRRVH